MPTTTVLYGSAYDGKNTAIFGKCLEKIRRHEGHACLYLVCSDVRVQQLRDVIFKERSGCFHFPVTTFPDFIKHLYRKLPDSKRVLNDLEQKILLQEILAEYEQGSAQFYFRHFREHPGIVTKIKEFIRGLRRLGLASSQDLKQKFEQFPEQPRPVHKELLTLFDLYTHRLHAVKAIDETGIFLEIAAQAVSNQLDLQPFVPAPELLALESYYELTLPEQQIFTALCSQFEQTFLTLDLSVNPYNLPEEKTLPKPFHIFQDFVRYIQRSGFSVRKFSPPERQQVFPSWEGLGAFRGRCFSGDAAKFPSWEGQGMGKKMSKYHETPEPTQEENFETSPQKNLSLKEGPREIQLSLLQPVQKPTGVSETHRVFEVFGNSERLTLMPCRTRKEEVTEIARKIRRLYQEKQISTLREVGVTFPIIERYERLIREIFPCFGIPFTMFQGYSLGASAVVVTIFRILQVVLENYSLDSVARLFSTPLVEFEVAEAHKQDEFCPLPVLNSKTYHELDSLARAAGILRGRKEWIEKLTAYQKTIEEQQSSSDGVYPEQRRRAQDDSAQKDRHAERGRSRSQTTAQDAAFRLLSSVYSLLDVLARFEGETYRPFETFIDLLQETITQFQIPHRILQVQDRNIRNHDLAAFRKFWGVLEILQHEFSSSSFKNKTRPKNFTFKECCEMLRLAVQGESYYLPETLAESVFVMGRLDTRQVQFRYLFLGGLIEKDFPGQEEPNIFLTAQEAETIGLPTYRRQSQEAAYLFWLNTHNPTEHVYLSYPLQEGEKDVLQSSYIDRVTQVFENKEQDVPLEEVQKERNPQEIYTYSELYQWLGETWERQFSHWDGKEGGKNASKQHNAPDPSPTPSQEGNSATLPRKNLSMQAGWQECWCSQEALDYLEQERGTENVKNFLLGLKAQDLRVDAESGVFEGVLASQWAKQVLNNRYTRHVYSVSEFDLYVRCPLKFFFQRILRLEPLPVFMHGISASDIGTLLHTIVYRFYTDSSNGHRDAKTGEVDREFLQRKAEKDQWIREAYSRMTHIAREEMNTYDLSGAFGESFTHSLLAGLASADDNPVLPEQQGLLAKFIEQDANDTDKVLPHYLEAHFGMPDFAAYLQQLSENPGISGYELSAVPYTLRGKDRDGNPHTIKIRGEIDRIDLAPQTNGEHSGHYNVVIYDYKTGSVPPVQKIKAGQFFQLPLYLLAAQELLGETCEVIGGGYYQLKSVQAIGKKGLLGSKAHAQQSYFKGTVRTLFDTYEEFISLLHEYANRAIRVTRNIQQGRFHPTMLGAQDAGCRYCEYQQICRVDYQKMSTLASK